MLARFTELEDERTTINSQLAGLAKTSTGPGDPALLDALPMLGDRLAQAPARLQQQLYDAFDLQALYKKNTHQVTIHVTITDSTPHAVAAIINDADGNPGHTPPNADGPASFSDLAQAPMRYSDTKIMESSCPARLNRTWVRIQLADSVTSVYRALTYLNVKQRVIEGRAPGAARRPEVGCAGAT